MSTPEALATQIEQLVLNRIASDKLVVPAFPAAANNCLTILKDPNHSQKSVALALERDPNLALQVLRVANSAAHGSGARTIEQAVTRLGSQRLKSVLVEACARAMFESRDVRIARACEGLWEHSIAVAMVARDLAALSGSAEGEVAYLVGLLHDVGKPVLAGILLEAEKIFTARGDSWVDQATFMEAIQRSHRRVAVTLAEKWKLPDVVLAGIRDCAEFDSTNRVSAVNFVRFANALAKQQGIYVGAVDLDDAGALVMIGRSLLGLEDEVVQRLAADLKSRVKAHAS